jgi:hypothetical protein
VRQRFLQLDRWLRRLKGRWSAIPGSLRLLGVAVAGLVCAVLVSSLSSWSNTYAMRARTSVVTVEPSCGRSVVWDLPPGRFTATSAEAPPPLVDDTAAAAQPAPARLASVRLAAGARARIERIRDAELLIRFDASPHFASCASPDALVEVRMQGSQEPALPEQALVVRRAGVGADRIAYRSAAAVEYVLPLEGRIVLGAELQHGAGWDGSAPPALLDSAEIEVRSLEGVTGHSVALRAERVDAGAIIDSTPCFAQGPSVVDRVRLVVQEPALAFDAGARRLEACARAMRSPAVGLVRPHFEGGMEVHGHVQAHQLGITAHQGQPRLVGVPLWQSLTNSYLVQALVVLVVLLAGADAALGMIGKIHGTPDQERPADRPPAAPRPARRRLKPHRKPHR